MYVRSHLRFVGQLFGQYFMEDSGESDVFSERDERSVASDSYDEIEFEELDSFALDKNADKSDDEEGPYSQESLANDQWLQEYQQERRIIEARERELQNRMDRVVELDSWYVSLITTPP